MPWPSAACCCSAAGPVTCSAGAGCSSTGLLLFSAASLAGGLATSQAWLLAARAVQGAGGAIVAPTALALIATTFPEGPRRNRAMGVYAAMSVAGGAAGLLAGGLLVTYASWRWVLFVNVPIGIGAALAALAVLPGTARRPGRLDLPGTVTGTGGVAALVYGLSNAATSPDGTSHWGDTRVVASLAAGVVLLAAFAVIEARSRHALLPLRLLRSRDRLGANLIMLGRGHRPVRRVLLPHLVRAGRVGLLRRSGPGWRSCR